MQGQALETDESHGSSWHSSADMDLKTSLKPLPSRLSRQSRIQSHEVQLASLSPVSNRIIPSPLASPITATANSLTALSLSSTPSGISGHDLSKVAVPRERKKTRPYTICSAESLLAQERARGHLDEDSHQDHSGQLSDPETSRRNGYGPAKQSGRAGSRSDSTTVASKSKPPSLKPATQLRVNLFNLVSKGYLPADTQVIFREHSAIVTAKGTLIPQIKDSNAAVLYPWLQSEYETPSAWATAMVKGARTGKVAVNGWSAIKIPIHQLPDINKVLEGQGLAEITLDVLRKRYLADITEDETDTLGGAQGQGADARGTAALDRKKRKRHTAASEQAARLRIVTEASASDREGRVSTTTRPRKRTMSDLSGMVPSELITDRQLHLEAAGALFSMQDPFSSPTSHLSSRRDTQGNGSRQRSIRHRHVVRLESLARRHQEQEAFWAHSPVGRMSALRVVRASSMTPAVTSLGPSNDKSYRDACFLCGTVCGDQMVSYKVPPQDKDTANDGSDSQGVLQRCSECGECYHAGCLRPSSLTAGHPSFTRHDRWRCPRCCICSCCEKSIHSAPLLQESGHPLFKHQSSLTQSSDIPVLSCDRCQSQTHLECQIILEPALKYLTHQNILESKVEWTCLVCRTCVECGYRVRAGSDAVLSEDSLNNTGIERRDRIEGQWSHGSSLCPSCTSLAGKGNVCPLCCRIYQDDDYETPMIFCDGCSLWVHVACDKGLQDRDYEELGEDSRQYFCPSCIPTPIPSPAHSSSSSMVSTAPSVDQSPWQRPLGYGASYPANGESDYGRESGNEDERFCHGAKKKDDILDLIKAAKEISDSESQANSPYSTHSPVFTSSHPRTMSASLESVAEVVAAEALLTIFSGSSTPISSTPYTSYPPSPFEPSLSITYDRHYSVINSPPDLPPLMRSMAFTPSSSSDQESLSSVTWDCQGAISCRCHRHRDSVPTEDYFSSRSYSRPTVPYHQIGQELRVSDVKEERPNQLLTISDTEDVVMGEAVVGDLHQMAGSEESEVQTSLYQRFQFLSSKTKEVKISTVHPEPLSGLNAEPTSNSSATFEQASRSASAVIEDLNVRLVGEHDTMSHPSDLNCTKGLRIGGLIIHRLGSFVSTAGVHHETGMANDVDLEVKCAGTVGNNVKRPPGHSKQQHQDEEGEVLAMPLGFKCERQLLSRDSSRCSVIAEIVPHDIPQSNTSMSEGAVPVSSYSDDESPKRALVWRVVLKNNEGTSEFFSESIKDVVETIFRSSESEPDHGLRLQHSRHFLQSPGAFFGLDHPILRRRIRSMADEKQVASRIWLRYQKDRQASLSAHTPL
ncbi:hypothetical protein EDD11_006849 [Mortierella claussenii]|nr:hypothetical protein EDD11_006849 [Mortierella claussenii]